MIVILGPISALLLASAILLTGNGLQGTLIAVRGNLEGFALPFIGLFMSAYFAGFMVGCFYNPVLVRRVGHIRTFAALASIASASALLHALLLEPYLWLVLRVITGFCFAGLSMITESWINERTPNESRGRIISVYRIVDLGSVTVGQILLSLADPGGFVLFAIVSILVSLALVPVSLTTSVAPRPIETSKIDFGKVFRVSPLAAWGTTAAGFSNGAFWGLAPVFVLNAGYSTADVSVFMSAVILGGALAQFPVGMISDRIDRRYMLLAIALLGAATSSLVSLSPQFGREYLIASGFAFGAMALSLYSMAVAHANDRAEDQEFVEVSSSLLFLFSVGAVVGPFLAAVLVRALGNEFLFYYMSLVLALLFVFGVYRLTARSGVPIEDQAEFVPAPRTSPEIFELDPRSDGDHAEDGEEVSQSGATGPVTNPT